MCLDLEFGGVVLAWFSLFRSTNFSDISPIKPTVSPVLLFHEMGQDGVDTQCKSCCLYSKVVPGSAPVYILGLLQVHSTSFDLLIQDYLKCLKWTGTTGNSMVPQVGMNCLRRHFLFSNLFQTLPLLITFFATQLLKLWSDNFLYISNFQNDCIRVIWPPLISVHFASHLFNKKNSLHCFSSYKAKLLIDRGVLHPVTVYWAVYKCPDPWHWIKNCLEQWVEWVFRRFYER